MFNANYVKKETARRVNASSQNLLQSALLSVASHIPNPTQHRSVAVFNSLAHERNDPVTLEGKWGAIIDAATGKSVPAQTTADGKTILIAQDVPAYGYKVYREMEPDAPIPAGPHAGTEIENEFYRVRADQSTGNVISILDKRLNRELVDPKSKYQFNQFIAIHKEKRDSLEGTEAIAGSAKSVSVTEGPVFKEMTTTIEDEATGAEIVQMVRLYADLPRIDVVDAVKHARMMLNLSSAERYKDNIFYAFPVEVPNGQPRAEYAGGVVRPYDDQLRWGSHDYLSANRWVDVSSKDFGITVAPWNEQVFEFGEIRYNRFSVDYKPENSHLFGYAWSNRMTGLLDIDNKEPGFTVGYSITSHAGDWNSGAASRLGWSVASPLRAQVIPAKSQGPLDPKAQSFLSVNVPNVELTVLKESEQPGRGWIVRLTETSGELTEAAITSSLLPVESAFLCSGVEDDLSSLPVQRQQIRVHLLPFGTATVRLIAGTPPVSTALDVKAKAISGEKVALQWKGTTGNLYNIYRSADPADPPTAYTLLARVSSDTFTDDHLMPLGTYYYRIATVSPLNLQGPVSEAVDVTTLGTNQEPPPPVNSITVIALTGGRRMVAWDKSPANDLREYELYRSEGTTFSQASMKKISVQVPSGYSIETYIDRDFDPTKTYQYFVVPIDWAGNHESLP